MPENILTIKTSKFKSSTLGLFFVKKLGEGMSDYAVVPRILLNGSENYPDLRAINFKLMSLWGASISPVALKKGDAGIYGFLLGCLSDRYASHGVFEGCLELLNEITHNPKLSGGIFDHETTEREKKNLLSDISSRIDDKRTYAAYRLIQLMCKDEPFGKDELGSPDSAGAVTAGSAFSAYKNLVSDSGFEIISLGSSENEQLIEQNLSFGKGENFTVLPSPVKEGTPSYFEDKMDVTQGKLAIGYKTGINAVSESFPALMMLNTIFGGFTNSKLFLNVREKLSLCYYASSTLDRQKGTIVVNSGIEEKNFDRAKREIDAQLTDVKNGKITKEEFDAARLTVISSLKSMSDSPSKIVDFNLSQKIMGAKGSVDDFIKGIETVTIEEIVAVASSVKEDTVYFLRSK